MKLDTLFNPNSVAVIGATNNESKVGYALMKNILSGGTREVYPITLNDKEVMGHVAYTSITAVPGNIDVAVIAVPAKIISSILEECAEKEIKTAIVISAGFKEMGEEGKKLEDEMSATAAKHGIALLGPNCLGVMNAHKKWNASFAVDSPKEGGIAFVSQSGALGTALLDWANKEGVGFSKFVSLGNEAVLTELDFLEYLAEDEDTKAVLLYLEKVTDGKKFLELARKVTAKKPLVVLRAGRSERGSRAVASHTGSLAPSDRVFESALKQVGSIPIESLRVLFSLAKMFELGYTEPLQNLVIVTNGGGPSVTTADLIGFTKSLSLVDFDESTKEKIKAVLPPMAAVNNPVDVIGDAGPQRYEDTLNIINELDEVDAIITLVTPQMMTDPKEIAEVFVKNKSKKPLIPVIMGGKTAQLGRDVLMQNGMVNFDSPTDVVESLDALARGIQKPETTVQTARLSKELQMMEIEEMQRILATYQLGLEGELVKDINDIESSLKRLGDGPYAIKAVSNELVHKSDLKAVKLGLQNAEDIQTSWSEMEKYISEHANISVLDGMLIQKMVTGVECIVGMKRDATFGPVIVFGLGGVFVEILKDSSMRVTPVTEEEALTQIQEIKGLPLLTGARGSEPVSLPALSKLIASLSELSLEHTEIQEIDFNPVFATKTSAHIVDARFMIE